MLKVIAHFLFVWFVAYYVSLWVCEYFGMDVMVNSVLNTSGICACFFVLYIRERING